MRLTETQFDEFLKLVRTRDFYTTQTKPHIHKRLDELQQFIDLKDTSNRGKERRKNTRRNRNARNGLHKNGGRQ